MLLDIMQRSKLVSPDDTIELPATSINQTFAKSMKKPLAEKAKEMINVPRSLSMTRDYEVHNLHIITKTNRI